LIGYFSREDSISQKAVLQLYPNIWFNSWVAGAMGVKFLAQGNNSGSRSQLGIESGTSMIFRPVPYQATTWATTAPLIFDVNIFA